MQAPSLNAVDGIDTLRERMVNADAVKEWSFILKDYISAGNTKINDRTAIFNMNSAHDCPNYGTRENGESKTGYCQVPKEECYAAVAEDIYSGPLAYRRRQEYLWDSMPPELWAKAFRSLNSRKRKPFDTIRFSEAGDFRSDEDIRRVNIISGMLDVDVYTYSASHKLNWDLAENFTVNASNDRADYGDRRYVAVESPEDIPDGAIRCPHDYQKANGSDNPVKCGTCRSCISKDGPDVHIVMH